jgi:hypothetical protein
MITRDEAKDYIKSYPEGYFKPAKNYNRERQSGFICPLCGNGYGVDETGIVKYDDRYHYKCRKCGACGDIIDFIGLKFELKNFEEKLDKAIEIYGLSVSAGLRLKKQ